MPQPSSMLLAISLRMVASRSVPSMRVTMPAARACASSASFMIRSVLACGVLFANAAASTPATLPNTSSSVSEFEPRRLAPWMPTLEHSPAEYRPAT